MAPAKSRVIAWMDLQAARVLLRESNDWGVIRLHSLSETAIEVNSLSDKIQVKIFAADSSSIREWASESDRLVRFLVDVMS